MDPTCRRACRRPSAGRRRAARALAVLVATFLLLSSAFPATEAAAQEPGPIPGRAAEFGERMRTLHDEFRAAVQIPLARDDQAALRDLALAYRDRLRALERDIDAYIAGDPAGVPDFEEARSHLARCLVTIVQMSVAGEDVDGSVAALERTRAAFPDGRCDRFVLAPVADLLRTRDPERALPLYREVFARAGGVSGPVLDGAGISLEDLRGRVVLVDLWQSG